MSWLHGARARARLLFGARDAEARMDEEMRFHVEMEAERLAHAEGLDAGEARRRALVAFGGGESHREQMRDGRGLAWLGGLSLDFKLGFRMLVKYPGLTLVGGVAMGFAIWAGAVTFVVVGQFLSPTLPLPGGDRIVRIRTWETAANQAESRTLNDFLAWRAGLHSLTDLSASRDVAVNLMVGRETGRPLAGAEMTASAFRIDPEPPLLGRVISAADERPGSPPVVLLGYEVWRSRFAGDRGVVGRTVQLGDRFATVIGVMPRGFAFPVAHELWMPLQPAAYVHAPREGPAIEVFGRLAPGATFAQAQAEVAAAGRRAAAEWPKTHEHLQPRVVPYTQLFANPSPQSLALMMSFDVFAVMLLVLICSNVALLLFARAATRESELVVRSALGASRARIVAQLFAEALVLGLVSAAIGLAAAQMALRYWGVEFLERNLGPLPFWYDVNLSTATVLYALVLTVAGAVISGVVPARKVTQGLGARLKEGTAGSGLRFGGIWTAVIVTQVAVTVAFPAIAFVEQREAVRIRSLDPGFAAQEYLAIQLDMEPGADSAAYTARFGTALEALRRRVAAEPGVAGVTFVDRLPHDFHRERRVELDGAPAAGAALPDAWVSTASIDPSYFQVLRAPVLAGRAFGPADLAPGARVVVVDQAFVARMGRGRNPVGERIRFPERGPSGEDPSRTWYEIVGVVPDLGMGSVAEPDRAAGVYLPGRPADDGSPYMLVHAQGDPLSLSSRVRGLAAEVDPTLRVSLVQRLDEVSNSFLWMISLWFTVTVILTAIALLLSLAGIYAVLSFTVARRTREIGIRVALGAPRGRVVSAIFRKPLSQVSAGVAAGFVLVTLATVAMSGHKPDQPITFTAGLTLGQAGLLLAYGGLMLVVCLMACVVPTQRALRVQPTEALRAE